ncbi:cupin domain-containing protein [Actinoplanes friuliensis]|jgi:quercetin dioxygenase-like cupin family protein|uniref:Cupin n=1 Tax=Actinoplanes friuliensis DSM 7358 TaxID=1246995 RepID=U5VPV2_9ACTN|nr:cupin domain-containing protein [Actinoplanes friuliensis]AGZ38837.1 cupin [Actinoplanes friuliensis DSM 7358]
MTLPADNPGRDLVVVSPDDPDVVHLSVVGDTYTVLVSGDQTAGRYTLIDMFVPPGGGPPPHRHDFEEMFTLLEGAVEFTFRGEKHVVRAGQTVNIPANAPHFFHNSFDVPARMLCMCTPAGQEEYFAAFAAPVDSRTAPPPELTEEQQNESKAKAARLAADYRSEFLIPNQ